MAAPLPKGARGPVSSTDAEHIIRVAERAFDDFAGGGADQAANRKMLGIG